MLRVVALPLTVAAAALGGVGCGADDPESAAPGAAAEARAYRNAPPPLAALHREANELLPGGAEAFRDRLAELKGYPVVVNKWASWCPPCRSEFPYFQRQALERATKVAFIGVNSNDNSDDAREFLADFPVPYPSYEDPDLEVAREFKGHIAFPTTAFYDSDGELAYVKQGGYPDEDALAADIDRYAR